MCDCAFVCTACEDIVYTKYIWIQKDIIREHFVHKNSNVFCVFSKVNKPRSKTGQNFFNTLRFIYVVKTKIFQFFIGFCCKLIAYKYKCNVINGPLFSIVMQIDVLLNFLMSAKYICILYVNMYFFSLISLANKKNWNAK